MIIENNLTVIIRSVHERTESACYNLILEQGVSAEQIFIIHETPFSSALHKAYTIGIDQGKKWTMCVDADVLLRPGIISQIVQLADKMPEHVFETQGMILDYLFGGPKEGGIHLYRTNLLTQAIRFTNEAEFKHRPENHILLKMKAEGHPFQRLNLVVGLHDFEQFYKDIFRKCFVHSYKHTKFIALLLPYWKSRADHSKDFIIARKGLIAGLEHRKKLITIDETYSEIKKQFSGLQISEKKELNIRWSGEKVNQVIDTWSLSEDFTVFFPQNVDYYYDVADNRSLKSKLRSMNVIPFYYRPVWIIGKGLQVISRKLLNITNR